MTFDLYEVPRYRVGVPPSVHVPPPTRLPFIKLAHWVGRDTLRLLSPTPCDTLRLLSPAPNSFCYAGIHLLTWRV